MNSITDGYPINRVDEINSAKSNTQISEVPARFANIFWNIKENVPSDSLKELVEMLVPELSSSFTLDELVKATQKQWLQKMRWEVKSDTPVIQELKPKIQPLLEKLGLTSSFCPEGHYDTALLLAGRANIFLSRCYSLCKAINQQKIELSQIDILAGNQTLHPLELEILENSSFKIKDAKTEKEMVEAVADKMLKPLGIHCNVVVTDLKDRKPNTEQIVNTWLEIADQSGKKALIVSDPQFAIYQYFQCMESLYKKEIKDINFDLLSQQLDEQAFEGLNISLQETQENPIVLHLDTIARLLYTLQSQIIRGFI